ncbi:glycoside hydrolase family 65 protein [Streptomyces sp. MUM 203J]|uniref:glycoside hydrolase family 65 protein n=1 Tax=Streptomyces sp. MUM 203J TaxID=2791990 RepID=UPI001F036ADD|nr:glycosyl hydrolase family 65 protein [Streptomyces sp. MUM 203J]MCH0542477.1 glycoside hydrolase family 65 protein [Streptomyces sp. MUM 203J]
MNSWTWGFEGYAGERESLREALCTLGNGYFATRGALPECEADGTHYPGTYAAGCYNRLVSEVAGRRVENEDLVNLPNWLPVRYRVADEPEHGLGPGPWLTPAHESLTDHALSLDLRCGTLERHTWYEDDDGRRLSVRQLRLVHMGDPHLAVLRSEFTAENWAGALDVEAELDGAVANTGVKRYRQLSHRHLEHVETGEAAGHRVWLGCRTSASGIRIGMAARTVVLEGLGVETGEAAEAPVLPVRHGDRRVTQRFRLTLLPGATVVVDKVVALHTSRDPAVSDPLHAAVDRVDRAPGFERLLEAHRTAWQQLWRRAEVDVPDHAGRVLRLHLFHVLQTLSPHTADLDVGVPARGLHGEAYRGHVFWDELFVLPYLNLHFPEVSRALLGYRHRRLERARFNARDAGRAGALYPWQSGSDGREETQQLHLNPRSGRWLPDHSHLQHHVNSAVAFNVWRYWEATGDDEFLHTKGAEMLLEVARFWADKAAYDDALDRYRIRGVLGPDEYHDAYPGAKQPGLDDNAYTNVMAAWVLARALELMEELPDPRRRELAERIGLHHSELALWEDVSRRLHVPFHNGVISQFHGYGELAELDWNGLRHRYGDIRRLDRILEAEDDTVNRYQASKQADVLMLGYLFSPGELRGLLRRLGHVLDDEMWWRTVDYYLRRTSHGSTLSGLVHGWVLARVRRAEAWEFCQETLESDIADLHRGTTGEGIHLGAMAGTLDLVQRGLTGLDTRAGVLRLDPVPLPELSEYDFTLRFHGHWGVRLRMRPGSLHVSVPDSGVLPLDIELPGRSVSIDPGRAATLDLPEPPEG